jgi:hypothetical protein
MREHRPSRRRDACPIVGDARGAPDDFDGAGAERSSGRILPDPTSVPVTTPNQDRCLDLGPIQTVDRRRLGHEQRLGTDARRDAR